MTAPEHYLRFEAIGTWHEHADAPPREVVVSLGRSTLQLGDLGERPLRHWALPGMLEIGRAGPAVVYAMTPDGGETLAIRDRDMNRAIAAIARPDFGPLRPPPPSPWQRRLANLALLALVAGIAAAAPAAIRHVTAAMMPPEMAAEIGDRMLIALVERHGPACTGPEAEFALGRLALRLDPLHPPRLRVLDLGAVPVVALPGGTIVLDHRAVAASSDADHLAGRVVAARGRDALGDFLRTVGPLANLGFLAGRGFGEAEIARATAATAPTSGGTVEADARQPFAAAAHAFGGPFPAVAAPASQPIPTEPATAAPAADAAGPGSEPCAQVISALHPVH